MTAANASQPTLPNSPAPLVRTWFSRMWNFNKLLTLSALIYAVLLPIYIVAAILDPRLITNAPAFVKPLKFIISTGIYVTTFLWLLTLVQGHKRWVQVAANVTALGLLIENILVAYNLFHWGKDKDIYIIIMLTYGTAQFLLVKGIPKVYPSPVMEMDKGI